MRLLRNNPRKMVAIEDYGLSVTEWLPLEISPLPSPPAPLSFRVRQLTLTQISSTIK